MTSAPFPWWFPHLQLERLNPKYSIPSNVPNPRKKDLIGTIIQNVILLLQECKNIREVGDQMIPIDAEKRRHEEPG
jgi:hypothetical protein